jgi:hypothetical protein
MHNPQGMWKPLGHDCDRKEWERVRKLWNKKEKYDDETTGC